MEINMPLFCSRCGKENKETEKFCIKCNSPLQIFLSSGPLNAGVILENRYEIIELLKTGGMGAVYKARDKNLDTVCVVKELLPSYGDEDEKERAEKWFYREAEILAGLDHPNLPRVSNYFVSQEKYYLVMNFIEGQDLGTLLEREGNPGLSEEMVLRVAKEILEILIYLHSQNPPLVYRDIKPSNIMLHKDGRAMLIDFGIARKIQPSSHTQKTAIGTPGYAPEEQCYGKVEARSDIYALGATMHHLLTGIIPEPFVFKFKPLRQIKPEISIKTEKIVMKALEEKVSRRFAGAKEMLSAMNSAGTGEINLFTKQRKLFITLVSILVFAIPAILYSLKYFSVEKKTSGWQMVDSGTFEDLEAIFFLDREHGWAVGGEGTILRSKAGMGGKIVWEVLNSNTGDDLYDIYFCDSMNGLATGEGGILLYTGDGGKTWDREFIKSRDGITHCFGNIKFFDPLKGWISGSTILHTENGGKTWEDVDGISDLSFLDFHFIDPFRGWITGLERSQENITGVIILYTDNSGKNWSRLMEEELYNIEPAKIYFTDELNGWIAGSERTGNDLSGIILKTYDGGKTWSRETPVFPVYHYNEIYFTDELNGWAVGMEGVNQQPSGIIIRTGDGGKTWIEENIPADRIIKDIHFINNTCVWAAGEKGTILYYSE